MQLVNLLTTSKDKETAIQQFSEGLAAWRCSPEDIDHLFAEASIHSSDKFKIWGDIVAEHGHKQHDVGEVFLKNSLISGACRSSARCIVVSSAFDYRIGDRQKEAGLTELVHCPSEFLSYKLPDDTHLDIMRGTSNKSDEFEYKNRFDFLSVAKKGKYIDLVALPYQSIDYRICAAMHEAGDGLLERFADRLSSLVTKVSHDFVHATLKSEKSLEIEELMRATRHLYHGDGITGEEIWALVNHSAIYDELKPHGYAKQVAGDARALMDMVKEFKASSTDPDKDAMCESINKMLVFHLSNFVEKGIVEKAIRKDHSLQKLEKMFETKAPGNPISTKIKVADFDNPPADNSAVRLFHHVIGRNHRDIYQLSAKSFDMVEKVFAGHAELQEPLASIKADVEAMRREKGMEVSGAAMGTEKERGAGV